MKEFKLTPSDGISLEDDVMQVDSNNEMYKEGGTINENGLLSYDWWDIASWNRKPKTVSKIKNKELNERNKELLKVLSKITSDDKLRPVLGGVNFSEDGYIQVTDAHRVIQIKTKDENYEPGIYDPKNNKKIPGVYPNIKSVIPDGYSRDEYPVVDLKALKTYADAMQTISVAFHNRCVISYKGVNMCYRANFISDACSVAIALGYDKLNAVIHENTKMLTLQSGSNPKYDDFTAGTMPFTPERPLLIDKLNKGILYTDDDGYDKEEMNCLFNTETNMVESIGEEIDPLKDWIDEPFYGVDKDDVMVLKSVLGKNKTLPILEYLMVDENGIATVSDLGVHISLKTGLPKGMYYIHKNNILRYGGEAYKVEDFPSWEKLIKKATKIELGSMPSDFSDILKKANLFTASEGYKPTMNGICMRLSPDRKIDFIATDAHSLFFERTNKSYDSDDFNDDIILDKNTISAIIKIDSKENKINVYSVGRRLYLKIFSGKYIIKTYSIDDLYPKTKNVYPDTNFYKEFKVSDFKELLKIAKNKNIEKISSEKIQDYGVKKGSVYSCVSITKNNETADILVPVKNKKTGGFDYDIINTNLLKSNTEKGRFLYGNDSILLMPMMNDDNSNLVSFSLNSINKIVSAYGENDVVKMYFVDDNLAKRYASIFVAEGRGVKQQEQIRKSEEATQNKKRPFGIVVTDINNGEIINDYYNEYLSINNEEEAKAYEDKLRKQRFGTFNEKTLYSYVIDTGSDFYIKPQQIEKKPRVKDFVINLEKVLVENKEDRKYTKLFKEISLKETRSNLEDLRSNEKESPNTYYEYLLTQRPPSIGTHPIDNLLIDKDIEEINMNGRSAYVLRYSKPLSDSDIKKYELTPYYNESIIGKKYYRSFGKGKINMIIEVVDRNTFTIKYREYFNDKEKEKEVGFRAFYRLLEDWKDEGNTDIMDEFNRTSFVENINPSKPLTAKEILNNSDLLPENTFVYDATGISTKEGVKELMNRHENGQKLIVHIDNSQVELFKSLGWNITSME